ncbi:DUF1772 domain-containing protein [Nocardia testacea]|uniref:hypothetical protein n=1 Tax=Nocardia testacea TaxID=248551 RepID=UPI0002E86EB6|nr:hypothetical protein [Nocardia testacea]
MSVSIQILAAVAVLANAVVYGTDVLGALVMRSVYRRLDDATMTLSAGWGHYYADSRMPPVGVTGVVAALGAAVVAALADATGAAVSAGLAVLALAIWLVLYVRIAKPINEAQKAAARSGVIPPNARALQDRWDSILYPRVILQALALVGLLATLIIA